jgi:FlaA1/EpsC-like NDP-sugar epimerase
VFRYRNSIVSNTAAHKWIVFFFDTILGIISVSLASYLLSLAGLQLGSATIASRIGIVSVTYALFFLFFKTNSIAPNNHDFKAALRSLDALSGAFIALMLLNIVLKMGGRPLPITNTVLILSTVLSIFMIGGYRFLAALFSREKEVNKTAQRVAVYGSDVHFASTKHALENAAGMQYKIVALFLPNNINKTIDETIVYRYEALEEIIARQPFNMLLFAGNSLTEEEKSRVVDICLNNGICVKNVPQFEHWINETLTPSQLKDVSIEELLGREEHHEHAKPVLKLFASANVLITGAAGSIGSELARQVAGLKHGRLILCDQHETGLYELEYELSNSRTSRGKPVVYVGDVRDEASMENIFKKYKPQIVFHAAAYKHVPMMEANPSEAIRNNVAGTKVISDLSVKYEVERFLLVSTDKAINPTNVMGASKRIAEMYVQALSGNNKRPAFTNGSHGHDVKQVSSKFITTRFGNVLGSNGSVIPRFKEQIAAGGPVTVTHPEIIRYFMTISEACALLLDAVTMGNGGEVFRFDMGEPVKIIDLANKMIRLAGYQLGKDIKITISGLRPGEKLFEEMLQKEQETVTGHNEKILVSRMAEPDFDSINKEITALLQLAALHRDEDVVKQMKRIIPEFISNNSVYQSFDEKDRTLAVSS